MSIIEITGGNGAYRMSIKTNSSTLNLTSINRNVIAGITDRRMTSDQAIRTLEKARNSRRANMKGV